MGVQIQSNIVGGGEKQKDFRYILKIEIVGLDEG